MAQKPLVSPNRRRAPRRIPKRSTKVTCRKGTLDLGSSIAFQVLDVAETGIRLVINQPLQPHQDLAITLEGPSYAKPLRIIGTVMWCLETADGAFCAGVQFRQRLEYFEVAKLT